MMPERIDPEKWACMYDETLKILQYGSLAETVRKRVGGVDCWYLIQAEDRGGRWDVTGDILTGNNMEN